MKDPIKDQERNIKGIIAISGIILLIASIYFVILDLYLENKAVNIKGQITAINYIEGKQKATVKFRLTGHEYEAVVTLKNKQAAVDDKIDIKVDMYDPTKEIINNHFYIYIPGLFIATILLILSLPYLIKYTKTTIYRSKLKKTGFFINATITEVFLNNNPKLKRQGAYPYRLRAKYFNPQNQTEYIFESDDTYIDLNDPINEYKKTTVAVYLNQTAIDKYYIDLDSLYPPLEIVDPIAIMGPKTEIKFRFGTKAKEAYEREQAEKAAAEAAQNPEAETQNQENTPNQQ